MKKNVKNFADATGPLNWGVKLTSQINNSIQMETRRKRKIYEDSKE